MGKEASLRSPAATAALAGLAAAAVYLALPTARYSYDAVAYAGFIHRGAYVGLDPRFWNDYHVLYIPLGILLAKGILALGYLPDVLVMMQAVNALFAAGAVAVFALVARPLAGAAASLGGAALLAFSYAFWHYATNPEVYPPCLFFLLAALGIVLRPPEAGIGWGRAAAGGAALGLAVGFHAASALMAPVAGLGIFLGRGRRSGAGALIAYAAALAAVALAPYVVEHGLLAGRPLEEALTSLGAHVAFKEDSEGRPWLLGQGYDPIAHARGVPAGVVPAGGEKPAWARAAALPARALLLALLVATGWRARRLWTTHRRALTLTSLWAAVFFLGFAAYNPGSLKFVPFQTAPLFLLAALAAGRAPGAGPAGDRVGAVLRRLLAAAAVTCAAANLAGAVLPESRPETNVHLRRALFVRDRTADGDLVVLLGAGGNVMQKVYLPYFAGRETLILDLVLRNARGDAEAAARAVRLRIGERLARSKSVWVLSDVVEDHAARRAVSLRRGAPAPALDAILAGWRLDPGPSLDAGFRLYRAATVP